VFGELIHELSTRASTMTRLRRLQVDRIACDGRGLCAELLPEIVRLDDWVSPSSITSTFRMSSWTRWHTSSVSVPGSRSPSM
jgi:hypothetical protein